MPARHPLQSSAEQRASPAIAGARTGGLNPGGLWTSRLQKKAGRDTKEDGHVASGIMGHCSVSLSHGHECVHGKGSKAERSIGPAKTSVCRSESRGIGLARYGQEVEMPFTHAACRATGRSRLASKHLPGGHHLGLEQPEYIQVTTQLRSEFARPRCRSLDDPAPNGMVREADGAPNQADLAPRQRALSSGDGVGF
jgi:hypothetical protein